MGDNLENLALQDVCSFRGFPPEALVGIGNSLNNTITDNLKNNLLQSKGGSDSLSGDQSDDTLIGSDGGTAEKDTLTGGSGRDLICIRNYYNSRCSFY
ncbi:hypothetical protein [Gloeocapsopsis sp. IPPAS B-1203]|uniref:hypothetical protein n=1 Tax=Gloeocapsopsis sp. IPPAS B-1203 TaxID=2049454 RepID=UPI000C191217|nr:hypothetical protein [Gloeocapsopsis sp. IPPAS B-1203]PIG94272.1 hypothetical protein CSQ79_08120 [Gloeocapsopsis sp. IPPAS B-1203]